MKPLNTLAAFALGALTMFYLDPRMGRRRRALLRDRVDAGAHAARRRLAMELRHTVDGAKGAMARARVRWAPDAPTDWQLRERVRARIGHVVSHPKAIRVSAHEGFVVLRGHVLAKDVDALMGTVTSMPEVRRVEDLLIVHEDLASIPPAPVRDREQ